MSLVQTIYDSLAKEAATIAVQSGYDGESNKEFRFSDFVRSRRGVKDLTTHFVRDIHTLIYANTTEEWKQSNLIQDLLANDVLKAYGVRRGGQRTKVYYQTNGSALQAFQRRRDKGMNLSQKLWNQSENMVREMEYCISSAIQKGMSAVTLSKRVSKYLHDFPSLQKDYKQKYGKAVDCHDCEYRSIRLARSEINMAYRSAEQERWKQMDFIKGYEIKLSGSHPKDDICDELAGVYPKWFKWTGWHPNDLCYVVPIVMTDDEWYSGKGKEITELPEQTLAWFHDNSEKIMLAKQRETLPYWIRDNLHDLEKPMEIASKDAKRKQMSRKSRKDAKNSFGKEKIPTFKPEQEENHKELERILGITKQPYMTFEDADSGNGNSLDNGAIEYKENCQCCVVAHELRRRGFDVTAKGRKDTSFYEQLEDNTAMSWLNTKKKPIQVNVIKSERDNENELYKKLMKQLSSGGRYTIEWDYKDKDLEGHIVCSEMIDGKLIIYDPQKNGFWSLHEILSLADISAGIGILRVDGLLVNTEYIDKIVTVP